MSEDPSKPGYVLRGINATRNGLIAFLGVLIAFGVYMQSILGDPTHAPVKK